MLNSCYVPDTVLGIRVHQTKQKVYLHWDYTLQLTELDNKLYTV